MPELLVHNIKYEINLFLNKLKKEKGIYYNSAINIKVLAPVYTGVSTFSFFLRNYFKCRGPPLIKLRKLFDWRWLKCQIDQSEEDTKIILMF